MGVVWRARDEKLERVVALKFLPETVAADTEAVRDLKRETRRCLDLTHANIVRVYDFVEENGTVAIGMEFVLGQSLAKRKAEAPSGCLSVVELTPIVGQLCEALDYAHHRAKIVHRDLKPANVLVAQDGEVKVTDFGIARSLSESSTRLTGVGGDTSGTIPYMSPQQVRGQKPTEADDIYALGATLYELLTSKPPFFRGDPFTLMKQIAEEAPRPLAQQREELEVTGAPFPPAWEETIMACLAKDPKGRPKSVAEVAKRLGLDTRSGTAGVPPSPGGRYGIDEAPTVVGAIRASEPAAEANPVKGKSRGLLWAGLVLASLLIAGLGYHYGVAVPGQKQKAHAAEEKRVADERALKEEALKQQEITAAKVKADQEQSDYTAIVMRIGAVRNDAQRADFDAVERAEQAYLAVAPERFKGAVEKAWEDRRAAWLAFEASHRPGSLMVDTDPPGATVILYPSNERKTSPADFRDIKPGQISFRVEKEGYEPQDQTLVIQPGTLNRPSGPIRLLSLTGSAFITSQPSGVRVSLDGNNGHFEGVTPYRQTMIPPGTYQATLQRDNWRPVVNPITIKRNEEATLAVDVRGINLKFESTPEGAQVMLNGKESGVTPLNLADQPPGQYLVTLTGTGYDPSSRTITADKDTSVNMTLVRSIPRTSTLVLYRESHLRASIVSPTVLVNGQVIGKLPNGRYMTLVYPVGGVDVTVDEAQLHLDLPEGKTTYVEFAYVDHAWTNMTPSLKMMDESLAKDAVSKLSPTVSKPLPE